jgi:hypothetical protein
MLFNPLAHPFVKDHNEQLCEDMPNYYPLVVVKFKGIAPFKKRVDHPSGKSFLESLPPESS